MGSPMIVFPPFGRSARRCCRGQTPLGWGYPQHLSDRQTGQVSSGGQRKGWAKIAKRFHMGPVEAKLGPNPITHFGTTEANSPGSFYALASGVSEDDF